ncbi:Aldedh domain-containing protein [Aphelenchoides bicaudatus]|nr:Aldedh domain-containing protein [Aphelenchoides bicaudatus]
MAKQIEIPRCIKNFRAFASAILCHTNPSSFQDQPIRAVNYVKQDSIGVASLICPWNLPLYLLSFKLAPALACGNTVVCKPSEMTSATAFALMHAFVEAGFPPGVVNMVLGTGERVGEPMCKHPLVNLISFTGSTLIGRRIAALAAPAHKKLSLELGGKNAAVVFGDVDFDEVMPGLIRSCFANQGLMLEILMSPIPPWAALISRQHFEKVTGYIDYARQQGCTIHCGGAAQLAGRLEKGYFVRPTVISKVSNDSRLVREEIFGPVVVVIPFETADEVVQLVNSVDYGLSASVWSKQVDNINSVANRLRVGTVWCNCWLVRDLNMPFGGTKQSGTGREGIQDSLHFFTEQKTICIKLPN